MTDSVENIHSIFKLDPSDWMQYVYKQVSIVTDDGIEHTGWVFTVDPVSSCYVLVQFKGGKKELEMVMGHAVAKVTILDEDSELHRSALDSLFKPSTEENLSPQQLESRRSNLKMWLEKNRLPLQQAEDDHEVLRIAGVVSVRPPYNAENCSSTNEIILGRIQGLIKNMPKDHDSW